MQWSEVEQQIKAGDSDRLELKRWEAIPGKVADAICAMANTEGGLIVLGVADDGTLVGVPEDPDRAQERLTSLLGTGLIRREMLAFNGTEPSLCNERVERYVRLTLWRKGPLVPPSAS